MNTSSSSSLTPRPRFRFGLRSLLIFMAVVCVVLGLSLVRARLYYEQKRAAEKLIIGLGGRVEHAGWARGPSPGANPIARWAGFVEPMESRWRVKLSSAKISPAQLQQLSRCSWIRGLDLSNTSLDDSALADVAAITKLRELNLSGTRVTDEGLKSLISLEQLCVLDVSNTAVTYEGLAKLEHFFREANFQEQLALTHLKGVYQVVAFPGYVGDAIQMDMFPPPTINKCHLIDLTGGTSVIRPQDLEDLRHLKSASIALIHLGKTLPASSLKFLAELSNLRHIGIYDGAGLVTITSSDLVGIAQLPQLMILDLSCSQLKDDDLAGLSNVRQLQHLYLNGRKLTPKVVHHLKGLEGLQTLSLNMWYYPAANSSVGVPPAEAIAAANQDLLELTNLPHLEQLSVTGGLFVDDVVASFVQIKHLKSLKLDGRYCNEMTAQQIQSALPNCKVERMYLEEGAVSRDTRSYGPQKPASEGE